MTYDRVSRSPLAASRGGSRRSWFRTAGGVLGVAALAAAGLVAPASPVAAQQGDDDDDGAGAVDPPASLSVVDTGDSVAAGTGTDGYIDPADSRRASRTSRAAQAAARLQAANPDVDINLTITSSHGATTGDYTSAQVDDDGTPINAPQLDSIPADADAVIVGIGGNDAGFSAVMTDAVTRGGSGRGSGRQSSADRLRQFMRDEGIDALLDSTGASGTPPDGLHLADRIVGVLEAIRSHVGDDAAILVTNYPIGITPEHTSRWSNISPGEAEVLAEYASRLNEAIAVAVERCGCGAGLVDLSDVMQGHEVYTREPWAHNELRALLDRAEAFHPNTAGHAAMSHRIAQALAEALGVKPPDTPIDPAEPIATDDLDISVPEAPGSSPPQPGAGTGGTVGPGSSDGDGSPPPDETPAQDAPPADRRLEDPAQQPEPSGDGAPANPPDASPRDEATPPDDPSPEPISHAPGRPRRPGTSPPDAAPPGTSRPPAEQPTPTDEAEPEAGSESGQTDEVENDSETEPPSTGSDTDVSDTADDDAEPDSGESGNSDAADDDEGPGHATPDDRSSPTGEPDDESGETDGDDHDTADAEQRLPSNDSDGAADGEPVGASPTNPDSSAQDGAQGGGPGDSDHNRIGHNGIGHGGMDDGGAGNGGSDADAAPDTGHPGGAGSSDGTSGSGVESGLGSGMDGSDPADPTAGHNDGSDTEAASEGDSGSDAGAAPDTGHPGGAGSSGSDDGSSSGVGGESIADGDGAGHHSDSVGDDAGSCACW